MHLLPTNVINLFRWILVTLILRSFYAYSYGLQNVDLFAGGTYLARFLNYFLDVKVDVPSGINAIWLTILVGVWARLFYRIGAYIEKFGVYFYVLFIERKRIKKISLKKIILYSFTWPIFDIVGRYTTYIALFKKVGWKPVPHNSKITIDDLDK